MFRTVRAGAAVAAIASSLFIATIDAPPSGASSSDQAAFVAQINSARAARGLSPLSVNATLASVAQNWAGHMASTAVMSHNPSLSSQIPSGWRSFEENVGMGPTDAVIESSFAASPDHYGNMVDNAVTEVGVGVVSAQNELWVVEDFWGGSSPSPPLPIHAVSVGHVSASSATSAPAGSSVSRSARVPALATPLIKTAAAPGAAAQSDAGTSGPPANLNTVANQVQYFNTWN